MKFRSHSVSLLLAAWLPALLLCLLLPLASAQSLATYPPVLASISGCPVSAADNTTLLCTPSFTLTLVGSAFSSSDIVNISNFACTNPSVSPDYTQLTCNIQDVYPLVTGGLGVNLPVSVTDLSTGLSSNALTTLQLVPVQPVSLSSISGCVGSGASTNGCDLSSSIITVTGSGFQIDAQPWYLVIGFSADDYILTDYSIQYVKSFIVNDQTLIFALNYTNERFGIVNGLTNATGTMAPLLHSRQHCQQLPRSVLVLRRSQQHCTRRSAHCRLHYQLVHQHPLGDGLSAGVRQQWQHERLCA